MDKDLDADLVLRHSGTGQWLVFHIADRAVQDVAVLALFQNQDWQMSQTGDYDADGDADILLRRASTGLWRTFIIENRVSQGNSQANIWSNQAFELQD